MKLQIFSSCKAQKLSARFSHGRSSYKPVQVSILDECAGNFQKLKTIHARMVISGDQYDPFLQTKLATLYAKFRTDYARQLFDEMPNPRLALWNVLIREYARNQETCKEALDLFTRMNKQGDHYPDNYTFPFAIKACGSLLALDKGRQIHAYVIREGFDGDSFVGNSLIGMYSKCGLMGFACKVFDKMPAKNVVSMNAMLSGHALNGQPREALKFFGMRCKEFDLVSLKTILPVCATLGVLLQGQCVHGYVIRHGFVEDIDIGTSLIDMYFKCKLLEVARRVFMRMPQRDVVTWNALIAGYGQSAKPLHSLRMFVQMRESNDCRPDIATIRSVVPALAELAVLVSGKCAHGFVLKCGFDHDLSVGTALVEMYSKCGDIDMAKRIFDGIGEKDRVTWSALIAGYSLHGLGSLAIESFNQMQKAGLSPDGVTFVSLLSACSYSGMVDQGWSYFHMMTWDYKIEPRVEHYACMVHLMGRSGRLSEAEELIKNMPVKPDSGVYGALLGACRIHRNICIAERAATRLFELDPGNTAHHVVLSNIYASAGRMRDVARVRSMIKRKGLKVPAGRSHVEVDHKIHSFIANDKSHPQSDEIYAKLRSVALSMKETGYVPDTRLVLPKVAEYLKEQMLWSHGEKLAIAFAIIQSKPDDSSPIKIVKNIKTCEDCHTFAKFISKSVGREIVLRDFGRFHRFKDGVCSCGDYW